MPIDQDAGGTHAVPMAIAAAITDLMGKERQVDSAARLGVDQPTVSAWKRGARQPTLAQLEHVERVYDKPRGWILQRAGLVDATALAGVEPVVSPAESTDVAARLASVDERLESIRTAVRELGGEMAQVVAMLREDRLTRSRAAGGKPPPAGHQESSSRNR